MTAEATCRAINSPDYYSEAYIRERVATSITELKRREGAPGVNIFISDLIAENYENEILFYTNNHPANFPIAELCRRALAMAGIDEPVTSPQRPLLDDYIVSPYDSVLKMFPRLSTDNDGFVSVRGDKINRIDDLIGCFEYYDQKIGRGKLEEVACTYKPYLDFIEMRNK